MPGILDCFSIDRLPVQHSAWLLAVLLVLQLAYGPLIVTCNNLLFVTDLASQPVRAESSIIVYNSSPVNVEIQILDRFRPVHLPLRLVFTSDGDGVGVVVGVIRELMTSENRISES